MPLGCGCLLLLGASVAPRLALLFTWLFTSYLQRAFESAWMIGLGILFLPWTTLWYTMAWNYGPDGVGGLSWLLVGMGFLSDLGSYARSAQQSYARRHPPVDPYGTSYQRVTWTYGPTQGPPPYGTGPGAPPPAAPPRDTGTPQGPYGPGPSPYGHGPVPGSYEVKPQPPERPPDPEDPSGQQR